MSDQPARKAERPLSPHLQVYKPQMTSIGSVLHRATGIALAYGLALFVWWLVAAVSGPEAYSVFTGFCGSIFGQILLLGWTVSFYYHMANGIRHLFWDAGLLLKIKNAYAAGYFVLFVTALLTGATWFCILTKAGI